jgi:flavin-dependent dehydrogenase
VELDCDVLVVGAGCGGVAAALTAARMGRSVVAPVTGVDAEERARAREGARELSLAFVHWLQTEAPRPDGGTG